jgi:inner membrane protein
MSPVTHFFTGWVLANCAPLARRDRALVTLASMIPDVDGLGLVPQLLTANSAHPLMWFSRYHHSLHTLVFALAISLLAFAMARRKWLTALLALLSFHLHLLEDVLGSRGPDGYQWPIPYLKPFSSVQIAWSRQWALNAWPNAAITAVLILFSLWLARARGFSFMEIFSRTADAGLIAWLRERFPARSNPVEPSGK